METSKTPVYHSGRPLESSGMQERHSREHAGKVCLDSQSALSRQLERVTGGPPELHLGVPQLLGSEHGGRHRQPDTGGRPAPFSSSADPDPGPLRRT